MFDKTDQLCVNTIRTLAMDAVQAADSGHPGTAMVMAPVACALWQRHLRYDPNDPVWPPRCSQAYSVNPRKARSLPFSTAPTTTCFWIEPAALVGVDLLLLLGRAQTLACNAQGCNCPVDGDNGGARLGIHPFVQPNVESAKVLGGLDRLAGAA